MLRKAHKRPPPAKDPLKEARYRQLAETLVAKGYRVRREKLKAGPGWKVISGACRLHADNLIFVDPRLPQDEQILFLTTRMEQLGLEVPAAGAPAPAAES